MTQDEEIISNISYTNSDFRTIFPQLLDTAKKLTNKWDPSLSNESDPGNILIKEAAIVGDKVNYHIDKNVLECFPLSATQQASARQIYDLVGYNMHWYKSAIGTINFSLLKPLANIKADMEMDADPTIIIPAGTVLADSTGEYVYTTLEPTNTINKINTIYSVPAIQGTINQYEINGNTTITIDNLDENLRLYFPQNIIAENGVFVYNKQTNDQAPTSFANNVLDNDSIQWMLVDNLTKYPAGSKVFKFGLDLTSDNCYIEFPEDVAKSELIGSGLNIYYTTTLGRDGNLNEGIINKFLSNFDITVSEQTYTINKYLGIKNLATIGGMDPESLEEAYRNYKKLIGTYNTLVTRRDYENAIYNLEDNSTPIISNALVTDRTSDMNLSQKVIQTDLDSDYAKNYVLRKSADNSKDDYNNPSMQSYDVVLYLLKEPVTMQDVDNYNESFTPDTNQTTMNIINTELEELKSVQHNFHFINANMPAAVNYKYFNVDNICRLKGNLITYYKVSKAEATDIQNNVTKALVNAYNSRAIDFGNELDYNDLLSIIKSADDRIRNISLDSPEYEPTMIFADGSHQSLYTLGENEDLYRNINNETLAKMILAGKVQLFTFEENFQLDFGQNDGEVSQALSVISTENPIEIPSNDFITLDKNDIIQILTPNLVATDTYNATVRYLSNFDLKAGITYKLVDQDQIKLLYLDSSTNVWTRKNYIAGTLIQASGENIKASSDIIQTSQWSDNSTYNAIIKSGSNIQIVSPSQITIGAGTPYYIITNNKVTNLSDGIEYYEMTLNGTNDLILNENEYFLYTNSNLDGIVILGSGTTLRLENTSSTAVTLRSEVLSLTDIMNTELDDIKSKWNKVPENILAAENTIIALSQGDKIKFIKNDLINQPCVINTSNKAVTINAEGKKIILTYSGTLNQTNSQIAYKNSIYVYDTSDYRSLDDPNQYIIINSTALTVSIGSDSTILVCSNNLKEYNEGFIYQLAGDIGSKEIVYPDNMSGYSIRYKSNMILTGNSQTYQELNGKQTIKVAGEIFAQANISQSSTPAYPSYVLYNYPINISGGDNVDVKVLNESTGEYETLFKMYAYNQGNPTSLGTTPKRTNGLLTVSTSCTLNFTFNKTDKPNYYLLPISYTKGSETDSINLSIDSGSFIGSLIDIYNNNSVNNSYSMPNRSDQIVLAINATSDIRNITVTITNTDSAKPSSISFGYIQQINGLNKDEINTENIAANHFEYDIEANNNCDAVISYMDTILNNLCSQTVPNFDWTYKVPAANKVLQPLAGESYFNPNHIYNKCTIAKIDFEHSNVIVNPSSIK